jgi:hypothetical protein
MVYYSMLYPCETVPSITQCALPCGETVLSITAKGSHCSTHHDRNLFRRKMLVIIQMAMLSKSKRMHKIIRPYLHQLLKFNNSQNISPPHHTSFCYLFDKSPNTRKGYPHPLNIFNVTSLMYLNP